MSLKTCESQHSNDTTRHKRLFDFFHQNEGSFHEKKLLLIILNHCIRDQNYRNEQFGWTAKEDDGLHIVVILVHLISNVILCDVCTYDLI